MNTADLSKFDALLHGISEMLAFETNKVTAFVVDPSMVALARQHRECVEKREVHLGLNIFTMVSDLYYRENFHSDVLKTLLDPKNSSDGYRFLHLFLNLLNAQCSEISPSNYTDVLIEREKDRIDIGIKDRLSKRAIIIENKIKDAQDQPRQLPNYLQRIKRDGYKCDAIVYLRLNNYKEPFRFEWTQEEISEVEQLLIVVIAYNETEDDLLNGWLTKCVSASGNPEAAFVFRQYGSLITALGKNVMNKPIMQSFYSKMLEADNYQTAQSLRLMLDDLIGFRRDLVLEHFKYSYAPFSNRPWAYHNSAIFQDALWHDAELGVDIGAGPEDYSFYFWDRKHIKGKPKTDWAKQALEQMGNFDEFILQEEGIGYVKRFVFPTEENQLYNYMKDFQQKLKTLISR